ncbi:hypothetical protein jhhlp_008431 [Lomentospora prolificans]|uniref:Phytochrome n=1 Tax=Lomentospora prolificans TaxID=41688 RepID=A0A2N3MY11_9PEZI|nr:hypothetical protein jhhlp_008431 [Lomentospora prolificans]
MGSDNFSTDTQDRVFPIASMVRVDSSTGLVGLSQNISPSGDEGMPSPYPSHFRFPYASPTTTAHHPIGPADPSSPTLQSPVIPTSATLSLASPSRDVPHGSPPASPGVPNPMPDSNPETRPDSTLSPPNYVQIPGSTISPEMINMSKSFSSPPLDDYGTGSVTTSRFKHVVTSDGHAIITGRDGEFFRCEDEPIQAPGAVQPFGALVAFREEEEGRFSVRIVSENSERVLGYSPREIFQLENFLDVFSEEQQENLLAHVDFVREETADLSLRGPEIFNIWVKHPEGKSVKFWCAIHVNPTNPNLVICEFERENDPDYPLQHSHPTPAPEPKNTLHHEYTAEELRESTEVLSKPLRLPQRKHPSRRGDSGFEIFDLMTQIQDQLAETTNLNHFLKVLVGIVKELTGYHRVIIYQFDSSANGKVVAELVDPAHTADLYYGLHFPAADIPKQARDLYKISKIRLLHDRDLESARLVCRSEDDLKVPLDMTYCYLRAMSPIHLKYLANMAVRGSMSISLKVFGDLWGLISGHWFGEHGMRNSFPIRKMCRLISNVASRNIERLSYTSSLQAQRLINTHLVDKNASGYIAVSSEDLLQLFDADFGVVSILGETKALGKITQSQEALAMLEYLRMRKFSDVIISADISKDFKDLHYPPGFSVISGLLYVPLSVDGDGFIVLFRKGQSQEVRWGGNPNEKKTKIGTPGLLEPRTSFKLWREIVHGKSREWTSDQIELARVLCVIYGKFIQVWRQQEATMQNTRLTKLLLANSAHQVRTPLNAIINYLEIALEGTLDQETRDNLAQSHSASKSLVYVINDLLDLTKTEEGQVLTKEEIFDLPECIRLATDSFSLDAKRKSLEYIVVEDPNLPRQVYGDKSQLRQAVSNVVANAIQYTENGFVRVESFVSAARGGRVRIEIAVQDSGLGMTTEEMDGLFRDLEQVNNVEPAKQNEQVADMRTHKLGLGLAVVGRIVRNMNGQLRVRSTVGQGSCFVVQLPFDTPEEEDNSRDEVMLDAHEAAPRLGGRPSMPARTPSYIGVGEERTLVGRDRSPSQPRSQGDREMTYDSGPEETHDEADSQRPAAIQDAASASFVAFAPPMMEPSQLAPPQPDKIFPSIEQESAPLRPSTNAPSSSSMGGTDTYLQVLIAEDDPINIKVLRKRLEKAGHQVHHAVNGEDCAMVYSQGSQRFDVILMDMQMPIMDGLRSTQTIRHWEKNPEYMGLSRLASRNGRIPIFAVSAGLVEEKRNTYMDAGFDGWIPKPINFERLRMLLTGITDEESRIRCLYMPGQWEGGGWFQPAPDHEEEL